MRTILKVESGTKFTEVELKVVDGKQYVELELAQFLALIGGKEPSAKEPASEKAKAPKTPKAVKSTAPKSPTGKKRGRKPKAATVVPPTEETVADPIEA